jgi:hypothetical protein
MYGLCTDPTPRRRVLYTPFYVYYTRYIRIFRGLNPIQSRLRGITLRTDWIDRLIFRLAIRRLINYGLDA